MGSSGINAGDKHQEVIFPILSPDPATNKDVHFLNYPVYVGANRGRGQVYPSGEKSNNNAITSTVAGQITSIQPLEKGKTNIIKVDQPLTDNPNVGGFGQSETEIVLQNPNRVKGMIVFFFTVTLTQILLVLKKKQFEKVQAAEMNF